MSKKKKKQRKVTRSKARRQPLFPWRSAANGLVALFTMALCTLLFGAPRKELIERQRNPQGMENLRRQIEAGKPEVILLGNSVLIEGVDDKRFSAATGVATWNIGIHGTGTATWYLLLKNVIQKVAHKPRMIVIFFRDENLTRPELSVNGKYKILRVDPWTTEREPLLDRLAYFNNLNAAEFFCLRHWGLYQDHEQVKLDSEKEVKNLSTSFLGGSAEGTIDEALNRVFADENMNKDLLNRSQLQAGKSQNADSLDFSKQLGRSFLPHIIALAEKNKIPLAFVRIMKRLDVTPGHENSAELLQYIQDLGSYFEKNQIPFIDFTHDERITLENFGSGDHLSRESGRQIFTNMLSEALKPYLPSTSK